MGTPCPAGVFTGMALGGFCLWGFYSQLFIPVLLHPGPPEPPRSCLGIAILQRSQGCDCSQSWGLALIFLIDLLKKNKNNKGYFDGNQIKEGSLMLTDCAGQGGGIRGREALSPAQLQPEPHSGPR